MDKPLSDYPPRVLSEEEIDLYINGERHEVDRLILFGLNRLASVIIPHAQKEDEWLKDWDRAIDRLGGIKEIEARAEFVNALIKRTNVRTRMMEKVSQSSITWALIAFLGFVAMATWHELIYFVKTALTGVFK